MGKCIFNILWLKKPEFCEWLKKGDGKHKAYCRLCSKEFDISKMGESALRSHMKGQKHNDLLKHRKVSSIKGFILRQEPLSSEPSLPDISTPTTSQEVQLPEFASSSCCSTVLNFPDSTYAEIKWVLKCVESNYSFNSCQGIADFFRDIFGESEVTRSFSCGSDKAAYCLCFGLAPYFKSKVFDSVIASGEYSVIFDESLNNSLQSKQLDILVRFWHSDTIVTRYLDSSYLGHSTAEVTIPHLISAMNKLNFSNLMSISMDGPSVNWKIFNMLQATLRDQFHQQIPNIGSCSLHIVNNSFRKGCNETKWDLDNFLKSLYWLFKDAPARREDFLELSKCKLMPLKFCGHRWLENGPAAQRALDILDDLRLYISSVEKGKFTKPSSKSYLIVVAACRDILISVKLNFFLSVVKILQPFLTLYQNDWPMLPFLSGDLRIMVFNLLDTFSVLKSDSVTEIKHMSNFSHYKFEESKGSLGKVSAGFVGNNMLKKLASQKQVKDKAVLDVQDDIQRCIITVVKNISEKSPISNQFVRCLSSLDPRQMCQNSNSCYKKMSIILKELAKCKKVDEQICDQILLEFLEFLNYVSDSKEFKDYDPMNQRLDVFLKHHLSGEKYCLLWAVVRKLLLLSHGQASVERGFSVNHQIEVENLKEETYVAKRLVKDALSCNGGLKGIEITKEMKIAFRGARQKYRHHLELKTREKQLKDNKRKNCDQELQELQSKKVCLEKTVAELSKSADSLFEKAEATEDILLVKKANSFRRTVKDKKTEIDIINAKIKDLKGNPQKIL